MRFFEPSIFARSLYAQVNAAYRRDEAEQVRRLLEAAALPSDMRARIAGRARMLVDEIRRKRVHKSGIDAFMHEYALSSQEGVVLMCLAEALLRIPDTATANRLLEDKLGASDWENHLAHSDSPFVNASTWALMLSGRILRREDHPEHHFQDILRGLVRRSGEPVIRQVVRRAMRVLGGQFVSGRDIDDALSRARDAETRGYRHSYDMLGEAARTAADARDYFKKYIQAIKSIGNNTGESIGASPGVSIKLSALHPRFEISQRERVFAPLRQSLRELCLTAAQYDIGLTVDAEEAHRLDFTVELMEAVSGDPKLANWQGLGLAVQAYQKRAYDLLDYLADMARRHNRRLQVRLVKGAYWDTEIKLAQIAGLDGYPVFTRKVNTDVSWLACARKLLAHSDVFYPQFATHNAYSVAAVLEMANGDRDFEFQRLHGMGEALYDRVIEETGLPCRIYAPVGQHEDLLPYLVRRLLENGANTSFVNRILDARAPIEKIVADPIGKIKKLKQIPHPRIPLPRALYGPARRNSQGVDLSDIDVLDKLSLRMRQADTREWRAGPMIAGVTLDSKEGRPVVSPADRRLRIGAAHDATAEAVHIAVNRACAAFPAWDETPAAERAARLERTADLLEEDMPALIALCVREGGKTIPDGVAEVREAVDFCRYYAARARAEFAAPQVLTGPTGEENRIAWRGRGVFACISPWNFPLAIFTGQIAAALAAGNAVIAKPAEQTPLIAAHAVRLMHRAGIPEGAIQLLPGDGPNVGAPLVENPRIAGVAFTGSLETAHAIHRALAAKDGPIAPLIAETGGQNAMIVDSSALLEQVVIDVLASSFQSAGQRCSALRVLFVQSEIADRLMSMLAGAMAELTIGDPWNLATDVGPVIEASARDTLREHTRRLEKEARPIYRCELPPETANGFFFPPQAFEIGSLERLHGEVFGPILHVIRYPHRELDRVIDAINATGCGLTFGIHTRIDSVARDVVSRVRAGNAYVNRNMIGAVVGVQPFGGEGLSGTGPKAGGPHYLHRFATERAVSIDTTAAGGNASLVTLSEDDGQ